MKKRWLEIIIHILFWVSTTWLITSGFSIQSHEIELINGVETVKIQRNSGLINQLLICVAISFLVFYFNAWVIIKSKGSDKNKILYVVLVFAITLFATYFLARLSIFRLPIAKQIAYGVVIFYFSISVAYSLMKKSIRDKDYLQKLLIEKKQAELNLLRHQLQPHFLFNALNNLMFLASTSKNLKLVNSFDKLSQLLRFVVEDNQSETITIEKEIQFLKNYIDLQLLRFEEGEVKVQFYVVGKFDHQKVEPGLFIPFVENAFKYGTEPEKSAFIEIAFDLSEANQILFTIRNKIMRTNKNGLGTGIETTRKRLQLIYPGRHKLTIAEMDDFVVQINIITQ